MAHRRHGHSFQHGKPTAMYESWRAMKDRCRRAKHKAYARYGGSGVVVCERWQSFENFLADMGKRPKGTTLDRIDGVRGYEPGNCRWATWNEQARNRKSNKLTAEAAAEIREWVAAGMPVHYLATAHGISRAFASQVANGKRWAQA